MEKRIFIVNRIDEPEFGCEGRNDNEAAMAKVYIFLKNGVEKEEEIVLDIPDSTLYLLEINEGMEVYFSEKHRMIMPVQMELNGNLYDVIKLLGKGKGGYSFLAEQNGERYVLKQIHHEPCEYYQFGDKIASEENDYERLKNIGIRIPKLIEIDKLKERILKEYIDGDTIFEYVRDDKMKPEFLEQMKAMLPKIYGANLNIDYFPTNFVVQKDEIYYIDFECNNYMEEWNFENWGIKYWSRTDEFLEYLANH